MKTPRQLGLGVDAWRPGQRLAIRTVLHATTPHVLIQAPTGTGKSLIAAAIPRLDEHRWATLTATKGLMRQYTGQFASLYPVMGMSNYECLAARDEFRRVFALRKGPIQCDDGPCHQGAACSLKDGGCLYFDRRRSAIAHRTPLTNYAYWLSQRRYARGLGPVRGLLCDEAHALPEQLMAACRLDIPRSLVEGPMPRTHAEWRAWAEQALADFAPKADDDTRLRRAKLLDTLKAVAQIDSTWAWDAGKHAVSFEPSIPRLLLPLLLPPDATSTVVHLSATATVHTLELLGINPDAVTIHTMPSRFPLARRPIYLLPGARCRYNMTSAERALWLTAIDEFIEPRTDRKGLIHTVSYARALEIKAASRFGHLMLTPTGKELERALVWFRTQPPTSGLILVSPSVMTGYDFPYTDAEYQVIAKTPFPDATSRIMKARIASTPGYRDHLTMQQLVQACGRINRAPDDSGETAIVDELAWWFIQKHSHLAPSSFLEALVRTRAVPAPLPTL